MTRHEYRFPSDDLPLDACRRFLIDPDFDADPDELAREFAALPSINEQGW